MDLLPGGRRRSSTGSSWAATICAASRPAAPVRMTVSTDTPLGGRFIWTQTTELRFPLPVSPDLGLTGRAFVDVGSLTEASFSNPAPARCPLRQSCKIEASATPRVGAGVGISWRTAFGLINVDLAPFVLKQPGDQTQIFRFGFGTRF